MVQLVVMSDQKTKIPGLGKIETMADLLAKKPLGIEQGFCVRARFRQFNCTKCEEVCEPGVISFTSEPREPLEINFARCNGCGACATACATGAIDYVGGLTDADLLRKEVASIHISDDKELYFACSRVREELRTRAIEVTCLARLHEVPLVAAAQFQAKKIFLVGSGCRDCGLGQIGFIEKRLEAMAALTKALGYKTIFVLTDEAVVPEIDLETALLEKEQPTRRELLEGMAGFFKKASASWVQEKIEPVMRINRQIKKDKGFGYMVPAKRQALLNLIKDVKVRGKRSFPDLAIRGVELNAERCNLCGDCALFCPTTAIALEQHDDGSHLVFYPAYCVDCGLCEFACRPGAVRLTEKVDIGDFCRRRGRALKSAGVRLECVLCSAEFSSSKPVALCPTCFEMQILEGDTEDDVEMMEPIVIGSEAECYGEL